MKRIIFSAFVISLVAFGTVSLSSAFFSDTEVSTNNILQAGSLDLKIDNSSYYNGEVSEETTWGLSDLTNQLFLNFTDLKPSDWGEDTISLHVDDNEAWACVDVSLTSNDDTTCTEPELLDDETCAEPNAEAFDGELAQNVNFVFWVDDGDNVLESDEASNTILAEGPASQVLNSTWPLADSKNNLIGTSIGDGLLGLQTYYIGKAWCFGDLTLDPVPTGEGVDPTVASGILCDGSNLNNETQTDSLTADFRFEVEQHRNNPNFTCDERG